jgi:hypothetical protein
MKANQSEVAVGKSPMEEHLYNPKAIVRICKIT